MRLWSAITPLLWRVIAFLALFVLISGMVGPQIITSKLILHDGFAIYGGAGKALLFALVAFVLLVRRNRNQLAIGPWQTELLGWLAGSLLCIGLAEIGIGRLLLGAHTPGNIVMAHAGLIGSVLFAGTACFGINGLQQVLRVYRRELLYSVVIGGVFYVFLWAVYALWQPLAAIVLTGVRGLLVFGGPTAELIPPNTLLFDKFGITVAEFCSGIESIALFTGLYAVVGLLDWPRLNKRRYGLAFPLALLLLFGLNIIRVYGLIMAGYYINPEIAFSLFHTYAGMVFFIIYSVAFWLIAYKYLLLPKEPRRP